MGISGFPRWMRIWLTGRLNWMVNRDLSGFHYTQGFVRICTIRMPFGLCKAPATFSRIIDLVLSGLNWETVLASLDDICVLGKTYDEHLRNLECVFPAVP